MAPIQPLLLLDRALPPTITLLSSTLTRRQQDPAPPGTTVIVVPDPVPTTTVVTDGNGNGPTDAQTLTTGAIVGIVIGSIVGFLLLVWIIRSCSNLGAPPGTAEENPGGKAWYDGIGKRRGPVVEREEVREYRRGGSRSRSRSAHRHRHGGPGHGYERGYGHRHHHHHHGRRSGSQVREVVPVAVVRGQSPYRTASRSRSRHERY